MARANPSALTEPPGFENWSPAEPPAFSGIHLYAAYRRPSADGYELLSLSGKRLPLAMDLKSFVRDQTLAKTQSLPTVHYSKSCGKPIAILRYVDDFGGKVAAITETAVVVDHIGYIATYSHAQSAPESKDAVRAVKQLCISGPLE